MKETEQIYEDKDVQVVKFTDDDRPKHITYGVYEKAGTRFGIPTEVAYFRFSAYQEKDEKYFQKVIDDLKQGDQ